MQEMVNELERLLNEKLDEVKNNETYTQIKSLYPNFSVEHISNYLKNEIDNFNKVIEIANLAEQYKKCCDIIAEKYKIRKLVDLFSFVGESDAFSTFDKQTIDDALKKRGEIKIRLFELGYRDFRILETELFRKQNSGKVIAQSDMSDDEYFDLLFSECVNLSDAFELYCINCTPNDGLKDEKLKNAYMVLRKRELISGEAIPGWKTISTFRAKVRAHYIKVGLL